MKGYSSREILKILKKDGWREVACVGDHHQFKHPTKKGRVTVSNFAVAKLPVTKSSEIFQRPYPLLKKSFTDL